MITVVGSGIAGLTFAYMAIQQGLKVQLVERGSSDLSSSCSWQAGGMLAPWCEAETCEPIVSKLGKRSMQLWPKISKFPDFSGTLVLSPLRDKSSLVQFSKRTDGWQEVDSKLMSELEPQLSSRFESGLFFPSEGHLLPRETLTEIFDKLKKAKIDFKFDSVFEHNEKNDEWVVDCTGLGAKRHLKELRGVKGEMMLIRSKEIRLNRTVRLIHPRHPIYIVPRPNNVYMVGATTIESEADVGTSVKSAGELLTQVYNLHPAFGEAEILEFNHGLRPAFSDNKPKITVKGKTIWINGLYRHGFLLAPAIAEIALEYVTNQKIENEVFDVD